MVGGSDWHATALGELAERWQDLARQDITSTAVLLPAPPRWGRTHLLNEFAALVEDDEAVSIVVRVPGAGLPDGLGLQALALRNLFREARVRQRTAKLLGTDWLGGVTQLASNVAGLFASPLATLVGLLLASVGVGAAGGVWDDSLAGQEGLVGRVARAVASVSVSVPVVVVIDDADRLEPDLAMVLIENLVERHNGQVLLVAAVNPGGELMPALASRAGYGLAEGRVRTVDAGPGMDYQARVDLAHRLCPNLPRAATRRIGHQTPAFADVFAVASAQRLAELDAHADDAVIVAEVDGVIDAQVSRAPSKLAVVLAWTGGIMHARQAERAVEVLGDGGPADDPDVTGFEGLIRLAGPASARLAGQVRALADGQRRSMAEIVLDTALEIGGDPDAGLVDKVVAWHTAHRVRANLQHREQLVAVQGRLVRGLEELDDASAAYEVAAAALAGYPAAGPGQQPTPEQDDLSAAVLRLARNRQPHQADPLIDATVTAVAASGATFGLEARVWAAIDLLGQPGQRDQALELTDQIAAELSQRNDLGAVGSRWRLLLAFHAGRAGYPAAAQQLVAPMLNTPDSPGDEDSARAVLHALGGPGADTRLQIVGLEAELAVLPPDADDDRLRVHHALAADYDRLGDHRHALPHGQQELPLRRRVQGADHSDTLATRSNIATWTGRCGDPAGAVRLLRELLPDQERVLGPDHPGTLTTRANIAHWTAQCGDPAGALRLLRLLLPDRQRVLDSDHPDTLTTRGNIASWAGECGDQPGALRLFRQLLPDRERVLGPDHPDTLTTRGDIAHWTGQCRDPAGALRLLRELLPDRERVLGPDHPDTLGTRSKIAHWTGQCGDPAGAVRLLRELLPDQERVLSADHPDILATRSNIAHWTARCGDPAGALRLLRGLLPDQERVFGADHPGTLATRGDIASWTWQCGDWAGALRLFRELLPDRERVLGPDHPDTVTTRRAVERLNAPGTSCSPGA
jgi:Tetratricopeptide repeat